MHHEPGFLHNLRTELSKGRLWFDRTIVLLYAIAAGLCVVAFTQLSEWSFGFSNTCTARTAGPCCSGRRH